MLKMCRDAKPMWQNACVSGARLVLVNDLGCRVRTILEQLKYVRSDAVAESCSASAARVPSLATSIFSGLSLFSQGTCRVQGILGLSRNIVRGARSVHLSQNDGVGDVIHLTTGGIAYRPQSAGGVGFAVIVAALNALDFDRCIRGNERMVTRNRAGSRRQAFNST